MSDDELLPVQKGHFRADTTRHHRAAKTRSQLRHVLAVFAASFPLAALFVFIMSLFRLPVQRAPYHQLCLVFLACGMVTLLFYLWARAEKNRRHENSKRNRELRHQRQAEELQREREAIAARKRAAAAAAEAAQVTATANAHKEG